MNVPLLRARLPRRLRGSRVLLTDDNAINRQVVRLFLQASFVLTQAHRHIHLPALHPAPSDLPGRKSPVERTQIMQRHRSDEEFSLCLSLREQLRIRRGPDFLKPQLGTCILCQPWLFKKN